MSDLNRAVRRVMPSGIGRGGSSVCWWCHNRGHRRHAAAFSAPRQSIRVLQEYSDCHREQRGFILGNGPSLRHTDLSLLQDESLLPTVPRDRVLINYWVAVNTLVIEQCAQEIHSLNMPKFIAWRGRRRLRDDPKVVFLDSDHTGSETFAPAVNGRLSKGSTVTHVSLQLAFQSGFEKVILIGVDHSFTAQSAPNQTVVSAGDDADHWSPGYFGRGFHWQLPDQEASERGWGHGEGSVRAGGPPRARCDGRRQAGGLAESRLSFSVRNAASLSPSCL